MTEFIVRERLAKDPEQAELYLLILSGIIFVSALMVPAVLVFSGPRLSQDVIQHAKPVLKAK